MTGLAPAVVGAGRQPVGPKLMIICTLARTASSPNLAFTSTSDTTARVRDQSLAGMREKTWARYDEAAERFLTIVAKVHAEGDEAFLRYLLWCPDAIWLRSEGRPEHGSKLAAYDVREPVQGAAPMHRVTASEQTRRRPVPQRHRLKLVSWLSRVSSRLVSSSRSRIDLKPFSSTGPFRPRETKTAAPDVSS